MTERVKNEIVVLGQKIQTRVEEIDIFKLRYWKENPRVNSIIKQKYDGVDVSDEEIQDELWDKNSVKDLHHDIKKNGGLIDEIIVKGDTVLEGNSRLCAFRRLYRKAEEKNNEEEMLKWSYIRSRILPDTISNEVIFSLLGTWHIKGKIQWDTFEKAAYLNRMRCDYGYSYKKIADSISETEKFVKDHIEAHDLMVENDIFNLDKFSYFYELVRNKDIKALRQEDTSILKKTINAIKENRFSRADEIRDLHKVCEVKKAKKEFFEDEYSFKEAYETAKSKKPEFNDSLINNIKKSTKLLKNCSAEKIEEIKSNSDKKYAFKKLRTEIVSFCKKIDIGS